jgi:hypothetical protein
MTDQWGDLTLLRKCGSGLADAKKARTSTENRVRSGSADAGLSLGAAMVAQARQVEKQYGEWLMTAYEAAVPDHVRAWAADIPGLASGELFPRIVASIGNPRIAVPLRKEGKIMVPNGEPWARTYRQLWSLCAVGDPERVPPRNATQTQLLACGKRTTARALLYTFSSSLERAHTRSEAVADSRFYKVLVEAREAAQGNVHDRQCQNRKRPPLKPNGCGTVANPEQGAPGSPWRPGHIQAHAYRITAKEFLRELWAISA